MFSIFNRIRSAFSLPTGFENEAGGISGGGIDAVDQTKRRRVRRGAVRSLDDEVPDRKRQAVTITSRNVTRNFELAAWAIRKHLDFVSRFGFRMRTGIESFDAEVESFVKEWSKPENFESTGRNSLAKSIRLAESMRCLDGDVFFVKLANGKLQAIESDRVKTPTENDPDVGKFSRDLTFNGVETDGDGRAVRFAVHSRTRPAGLKFARWVKAENVFRHGFYDRFDQQRGLSPVVASLNRYQDIYEGFDYAHARAKIAQLFGMVLTREAEETGLGVPSSEEYQNENGDTREKKTVKLGQGPVLLDLDPGEDAKFLENKTPAPEFQAFEGMMIAVALKALDIPYSFYDESVGNFFGNKAGFTLYIQSAQDKREDVRSLLDGLTLWRLRLAIQDGVLLLPRAIRSVDDLARAIEWTPAGIPWFDPRDVRGDVDAIKAGLRTRSEVRRERYGDDWRTSVAPILAEEERIIEELGIAVEMAKREDATAEPVEPGEEPTTEEPTGQASADVRAIADSYGLGVRAGMITPQKADEDFFRKLAGLPAMSPDVASTWSEEPTRRPITLVKPGDPQAEEPEPDEENIPGETAPVPNPGGPEPSENDDEEIQTDEGGNDA